MSESKAIKIPVNVKEVLKSLEGDKPLQEPDPASEVKRNPDGSTDPNSIKLRDMTFGRACALALSMGLKKEDEMKLDIADQLKNYKLAVKMSRESGIVHINASEVEMIKKLIVKAYAESPVVYCQVIEYLENAVNGLGSSTEG